MGLRALAMQPAPRHQQAPPLPAPTAPFARQERPNPLLATEVLAAPPPPTAASAAAAQAGAGSGGSSRGSPPPQPLPDPRMLEARTRLLCGVPGMPEPFAAALVRWVGSRPLRAALSGLSAAAAATLPGITAVGLAPGAVFTLLEACKARVSQLP